MAEVTPSGPKGGGAGIGGAILGGLLGLFVAVLLSAIGLAFAGAFGPTPQAHGACGTGILIGVALLVAAAAAGWLAWYMLVRNTSDSFGAGFVRGLSLIVAVFLLIPWPCGYTWSAFMSFSTCAR